VAELACDAPLRLCPGIDWSLHGMAARKYWILGPPGSSTLGIVLLDLLSAVVRPVPLLHSPSSFAYSLLGADVPVGYVQFQELQNATETQSIGRTLAKRSVPGLNDVLLFVVPNNTHQPQLLVSLRDLVTFFAGAVVALAPSDTGDDTFRKGLRDLNATSLTLNVIPPDIHEPRVAHHILRPALRHLPHWPPAPLRCDAVRKALDPVFFAVSPKSCDYAAGTFSCFSPPTETPLPQPPGSPRRWFFMGNSVTRGYAYALSHLLGGPAPPSRSVQIDTCNRPDRSMGCSLNHSIEVLWKNFIGEELLVNDNRDVCLPQKADTATCFGRLFANATSRDVLVLGSTLSNISHFRSLGGGTYTAPFNALGPIHARALLHTNVRAVVSVVTRHFPGTIIWHSYAFLRLSLTDEDYVKHGDPNRFYALLNSAVRCAAALEPRVVFLNLAGFQQMHLNTYEDAIHHGHMISKAVTRTLISMVPP
jgi:hypothetical protein